MHSEQAERNAQTIADLVALHNQLSVSTQQRQKDAGMVLQDGPGGDKGSSRRRADGEAKPKKVTAKKKQTAAEKKAREQAEAAEQALERQRAAEQAEAVAAAAQQQPQGHSSPAQQQQQSPMQPYGGAYGAAPYPVARPAQPAPAVGGAYPSFAPPPQYPSSAPPPPPFGTYPQSAYVQYSSQLAAHQQLYAAGMAPPPPPPPPPHNLPYADMYGGATFAGPGYGPPGSLSSPASHPYAPQPPPSPHAGQRPEPVGLSHQDPSSSGRYNPPGSLSYPPVSTPQLADAGQLTPNKISLPSISALLPSPFANGQQAQPQPQHQQHQHLQQQQQQQQHPQQRDVNSQQQVVSGSGLDPHAAAQQQQQQRQQAHYGAMSASQGRPAAHSPTAASPHLQQHGMQQGFGAYPPAGLGELQYPPHPGMAAPHPYDPYARPGSTTGSERECPPSYVVAALRALEGSSTDSSLRARRLSNGSSSTASSFQAGSPLHPHLAAPHIPGAQPHYSHLYNPAAAPHHPAYQYAPPPPQQPHAYSYASAQYLAAAQQPYGAAQGLYAPAPSKYAPMPPPLGALAGPYGPVPGHGGRDSSERGA